MADFHVQFITGDFTVQFESQTEFNTPLNFGEVQIVTDADPYEGAYDATPKPTQQTLPTKGKIMTQDVTVRAIPYFDVSNLSGGQTIYIANEV